MNRKFALTALSLALALGGATGALASGKKHNGAQAYAAAGGSVADPRVKTRAQTTRRRATSIRSAMAGTRGCRTSTPAS